MQMAESLRDVLKEVEELKAIADKARSDGDKVLYLALLQLLAPLQAKEERLAGASRRKAVAQEAVGRCDAALFAIHDLC